MIGQESYNVNELAGACCGPWLSPLIKMFLAQLLSTYVLERDLGQMLDAPS